MKKENIIRICPSSTIVIFLMFLSISFKSIEQENTVIVKDIDGNVYKTVRIGSQTWMAENLKATKYNNGTPIPLATTDTEWSNLSTPGYCWYLNDEATYKNIYGALYNWYTVNTGKLCPTDWHVPSDSEWTILTTYLGGESVAGGKMKETGTIHWIAPNVGATNTSGFTGLPGGNRLDDGTFGAVGYYGYWVSTTEVDTSTEWGRDLDRGDSKIRRITYPKKNGFSVRCLKD